MDDGEKSAAKTENPHAEEKPTTQVEPKNNTVTFKKKSKKKKEAKAKDLADKKEGDA
jgi:hypothetical protein